MQVRADLEFAQAQHDKLMETGRQMIVEHDSPVGYFYRAKSLFSRGRFEEATNELQNLLCELPNHAHGVYLLSEISQHTGDYEIAWRALEELTEVSKRKLTWHYMARLVNNKTDMYRLLSNWNKWKKAP